MSLRASSSGLYGPLVVGSTTSAGGGGTVGVVGSGTGEDISCIVRDRFEDKESGPTLAFRTAAEGKIFLFVRGRAREVSDGDREAI